MICECNNNQPIVGWFYGPKGFGGDLGLAIEACIRCVVEYHLTPEPQVQEDADDDDSCSYCGGSGGGGCSASVCYMCGGRGR